MIHEQLSLTADSPIQIETFNNDSTLFSCHFHNKYEIFYVKEGNGNAHIGDYRGSIQSGNLYLIGPNIPHSFITKSNTSINKNQVKGLLINFEKDFMKHAFIHYNEFKQIERLLENSKRGLLIQTKPYHKIIKLLKLVPILKNAEHILITIQLLNLLTQVDPILLSSTLLNNQKTLQRDLRLEKVITFLTEHFSEEIDLETISSLVAMNPSAFSRYFKEKTETTLMQYIQELRIEHACQLILREDLDIAQIAMDCGFNSISHFNKVFKRIKNMTPSTYRKEML